MAGVSGSAGDRRAVVEERQGPGVNLGLTRLTASSSFKAICSSKEGCTLDVVSLGECVTIGHRDCQQSSEVRLDVRVCISVITVLVSEIVTF